MNRFKVKTVYLKKLAAAGIIAYLVFLLATTDLNNTHDKIFTALTALFLIASLLSDAGKTLLIKMDGVYLEQKALFLKIKEEKILGFTGRMKAYLSKGNLKIQNYAPAKGMKAGRNVMLLIDEKQAKTFENKKAYRLDNMDRFLSSVFNRAHNVSMDEETHKALNKKGYHSLGNAKIVS